jgi:hypothetical protein
MDKKLAITALKQLEELGGHMQTALKLGELACCIEALKIEGSSKEVDAALTLAKFAFDEFHKITDADFAERMLNISKAKYVAWIRPVEYDSDAVEASYITVHGPDNSRVRRTFRLKPELAAMVIASGKFQDFPNKSPIKGNAQEAMQGTNDWLSGIASNPSFKAGA